MVEAVSAPKEREWLIRRSNGDLGDELYNEPGLVVGYVDEILLPSQHPSTSPKQASSRPNLSANNSSHLSPKLHHLTPGLAFMSPTCPCDKGGEDLKTTHPDCLQLRDAKDAL